jgi:1-acyl-sn-glycerol-3-phosphate acyltransferase
MFVDRTRRRDVVRVAAQMTDRLSTGQSLIVFLEGTSTAGVGVAPFRPALLASAVASGVPVHYAAVRYRTAPGDPPADRAVCWWGDMTFAPHFRGLLGLRWIEAHVRFGTAPVWDPDRKRLAEVLHDRVTALSRGEKLMDGAAAVAPKVGAASEAPA